MARRRRIDTKSSKKGLKKREKTDKEGEVNEEKPRRGTQHASPFHRADQGTKEEEEERKRTTA